MAADGYLHQLSTNCMAERNLSELHLRLRVSEMHRESLWMILPITVKWIAKHRVDSFGVIIPWKCTAWVIHRWGRDLTILENWGFSAPIIQVLQYLTRLW